MHVAARDQVGIVVLKVIGCVKNYIGDRLRRSLYVAELNRANFITSSISPAMEVVELQLQCSQEVVGGASSLVLANTYSSLVFFHRN